MWIKTSEQRPEREPNVKYSNPRVLVYTEGEVKILCFNHEHECWDDESGDDYYCDVEDVEYWMECNWKKEIERRRSNKGGL